MTKKTKLDPIQRVFYDPIERSELYQKILIWLSFALSILVLILDAKTRADLLISLEILFCIVVVTLFLLDIFNQLYFKPRADDMRIKDFLSHAFKVKLRHIEMEGYFNNHETVPFRRIAAQLLESALHSKTTLLEMLKREQMVFVGYMLAWGMAVMNKNTDFNLVITAAQSLLTVHLTATYFRIKWMLLRCQKLYYDFYCLFKLKPAKEVFEIKTLEGLVRYETIKSNGGFLFPLKFSEKITQSF